MALSPVAAHWSDHALVEGRVEWGLLARTDVERPVLVGHRRGARNPGAADWLAEAGRLVVACNHPDGSMRRPRSSCWCGGGPKTDVEAKIDGHDDQRADIAWLRFERHDAETVVGEQTDFGLREVDPVDGHLVGLEFWRASEQLPDELLLMLPAPPLGVAG